MLVVSVSTEEVEEEEGGTVWRQTSLMTHTGLSMPHLSSSDDSLFSSTERALAVGGERF